MNEKSIRFSRSGLWTWVSASSSTVDGTFVPAAQSYTYSRAKVFRTLADRNHMTPKVRNLISEALTQVKPAPNSNRSRVILDLIDVIVEQGSEVARLNESLVGTRCEKR